MNETELLRLAEKELLGEAKRAAARHTISGPSGWQPCPLPKTNKNFLRNTIMQTVSSNRLKNRCKNDAKIKKTKTRKLLQRNNTTKISENNFIYRKQDNKQTVKDKCKNKVNEIKHVDIRDRSQKNVKLRKNKSS